MSTVSQVLKKSGHDIYENMIPVIGLSFLWFVTLIPAIFILAPQVAVIYLIFTAIPGIAGILYAMKHKIDRKPFRYSFFLKGFAKFYWRSLIFSIIMFIFAFILVASWWYYVSSSSFFALIVATFQTYFLAFASFALLYTLPALISKDVNVLEAIRESIHLFFGKPFFTIVTSIQILTVGLLLMITVVSVPLLFAGMLSIFILNTYKSFSVIDDKIPPYSLTHQTNV